MASTPASRASSPGDAARRRPEDGGDRYRAFPLAICEQRGGAVHAAAPLAVAPLCAPPVARPAGGARRYAAGDRSGRAEAVADEAAGGSGAERKASAGRAGAWDRTAARAGDRG